MNSKLKILEKLYLFNSKNPSFDSIYYNFHSDKQAFIEPINPNYSGRIKTWKNKPYFATLQKNTDETYISNNNEIMRSKSELMLADLFYQLGIIYKYEYPLRIRNATVFPDFTFYNPVTEEEIYWEHFGKMDDIDYCNITLRKIEGYAESGIFLNKNLIVTFETKNRPLSKKHALAIIKQYELIFEL